MRTEDAPLIQLFLTFLNAANGLERKVHSWPKHHEKFIKASAVPRRVYKCEKHHTFQEK